MRDPIVEEVRRARAAYAAQFDHDLDRMVDDLKRRQDRGEFKVVRGKQGFSFCDRNQGH